MVMRLQTILMLVSNKLKRASTCKKLQIKSLAKLLCLRSDVELIPPVITIELKFLRKACSVFFRLKLVNPKEKWKLVVWGDFFQKWTGPYIFQKMSACYFIENPTTARHKYT